ncbi:tryptophan-rich sensory protein [Methylibium sp. Pch-M]|uniref:TspO/MBR family protein n=1 Tax=unclassified Methylibium TaxID=2633235 RepID=UPI0003F44737|nr:MULTISPECIES: TspO/MBR family protein [unclassified Methylibium]EWS56909.1 TspO/MBR family protein [Methylibium sp. T29]EWS61112.1 TspO/MBR family protein [Methylibium sp. T29-B]QAZ38555.1 tryptophan-rich sensory protein [Methylibium sp. Pch-M]
MTSRGGLLKPVLIAAAAALAVAGLGGLMTDLGPWYQRLVQPPWKPPDWLFGPAWTAIFALAAMAGVIAWRRAPRRVDREWMLALFALNGFLNVLWSLLFFRLHRPDWALFEVLLLWLSILLLIGVLARYARIASLLLLPYLAWVAFAGFLNLATVRLNGPFGA